LQQDNRNSRTPGTPIPMAATPSPSAPRHRLRRWLIAITVLLLLSACYAIALHRIALRIGGDIQDSLRTAPVLDDHTPRLN
jgi:hypothetical protein